MFKTGVAVRFNEHLSTPVTDSITSCILGIKEMLNQTLLTFDLNLIFFKT